MSNENMVATVTGLHGFAKGWTIFMIVYCAAFAMSLLQYLGNSDSNVAGFILVIIIFSIGMITGLANISNCVNTGSTYATSRYVTISDAQNIPIPSDNISSAPIQSGSR